MLKTKIEFINKFKKMLFKKPLFVKFWAYFHMANAFLAVVAIAFNWLLTDFGTFTIMFSNLVTYRYVTILLEGMSLILSIMIFVGFYKQTKLGYYASYIYLFILLLGNTTMTFSRMSTFPILGYIINVIIIGGISYLVYNYRNHFYNISKF